MARGRLRLAIQFVVFLHRHGSWWTTPTALALLILGLLIVAAQSSAVAPFIYTLF